MNGQFKLFYLDSAHKITPSFPDNKTAQLEGRKSIN